MTFLNTIFSSSSFLFLIVVYSYYRFVLSFSFHFIVFMCLSWIPLLPIFFSFAHLAVAIFSLWLRATVVTASTTPWILAIVKTFPFLQYVNRSMVESRVAVDGPFTSQKEFWLLSKRNSARRRRCEAGSVSKRGLSRKIWLNASHTWPSYFVECEPKIPGANFSRCKLVTSNLHSRIPHTTCRVGRWGVKAVVLGVAARVCWIWHLGNANTSKKEKRVWVQKRNESKSSYWTISSLNAGVGKTCKKDWKFDGVC